jgi:hypothetical protein
MKNLSIKRTLKKPSLLLPLSLLMIASSLSSAATLTFNSAGLVNGATDVQINGEAYDVALSYIVKATSGNAGLINATLSNAETFSFQAAFADQVLDPLFDQACSSTPCDNVSSLVLSGVKQSQFNFDTQFWTANFISSDGFNISGSSSEFAQFESGINEPVNYSQTGPGFSLLVLDQGTNVGLTWSPASPVPVPAAAWLFGSALISLAGIKRKK